ncbi:MAG: hypothetical protein J6Q24_01485 [Clostridia bacterium]|nr:hypothetical protein [Clostridia bacterium]
MKKILVFVLLVIMLMIVVGCTPENAESSNGTDESVGSAEVSEEIYSSELTYTTIKFDSFADFYELLALANGDDIEAFDEYFKKDGVIPPQKSDVVDMFEAFSEMSVPVLECEEYELSVILCDLYLDGRYYIELVYNGENDRLRAGAHTLSGSISADDNVTSVVADTVDLGEYSIQLKTMAKENNYCDIKGNYSAEGYGIYMAYKGGTVLPESLKEGVTLTTLAELIKPYIK